MDAREMAKLCQRVQDCARTLEVIQGDISQYMNDITPPEDIMKLHWKRLEKATAAYISASDELSSWLHRQLTNIESFRNTLNVSDCPNKRNHKSVRICDYCGERA